MTGRDLISKRTRNEFREAFVDWTLREIDTEFDNEDFAPDLTYQPPLIGQRRSLVEQYYKSIDFSDYGQVQRLLMVYETVIRTVEPHSPQHSATLRGCLERDGVRFGRLLLPSRSPSDRDVADILTDFDAEHVHTAWRKAVERRATDPEGAITAARTLLETVCKHILDDAGQPYDDSADLPKLWSLCADELNLSPAQHAEKAFKAILGNCQSIVNNLATIRNRVSDAHGHGRRPVRPKPRHAELAVNLAGTMAAFLVATWQEREDGGER